MLNDFYTKTSVDYTITIYVDSVANVLDTNDVVTLIMKKNMNDSDSEAVLEKTGTYTDNDGEVLFTLTPSDTDFTGKYYYEIKWVNSVQSIEEILESSTVSVLKRVFD